MIDRQLRARVLLDEAHALGLDLADLVAADTETAARLPTVAGFVEMIAPTFTPATAATYQPYWRLAVARLGDRRLIDVTIADVSAVVADAAARAKQSRPDSPGRSSQESCITALRALFRRAAAPPTPASSPSTRPPPSPNPGGLAAAAGPLMTTSSPS